MLQFKKTAQRNEMTLPELKEIQVLVWKNALNQNVTEINL